MIINMYKNVYIRKYMKKHFPNVITKVLKFLEMPLSTLAIVYTLKLLSNILADKDMQDYLINIDGIITIKNCLLKNYQ